MSLNKDLQQLQEQLITAREQFQATENELQTIGSNRAKLLTQLNENQLVQKEFELLDKEAKIYKLIGPVLFKQTREEADANISGRLDIINKNLKQIEINFKDTEKKGIDQRTKIFEIQNKIRSAQVK
ncbi:prefoldin beta-like domain containing protein [Tieghemostelium lacteum]|uniref:Prefoldin beta-like domain containing protein n=1 Tax=Tieghemostelium lacteum TaxID=361077 RepID=A0A151ZIB7_TIELA|nr:prefoldin beta-like domain containing protein [Tieghemostelium lacteum]|eukprot:KYQ93738.1 prefoldin beta-like domain containing protein [Tieghemostelium lacteum]